MADGVQDCAFLLSSISCCRLRLRVIVKQATIEKTTTRSATTPPTIPPTKGTFGDCVELTIIVVVVVVLDVSSTTLVVVPVGWRVGDGEPTDAIVVLGALDVDDDVAGNGPVVDATVTVWVVIVADVDQEVTGVAIVVRSFAHTTHVGFALKLLILKQGMSATIGQKGSPHLKKAVHGSIDHSLFCAQLLEGRWPPSLGSPKLQKFWSSAITCRFGSSMSSQPHASCADDAEAAVRLDDACTRAKYVLLHI